MVIVQFQGCHVVGDLSISFHRETGIYVVTFRCEDVLVYGVLDAHITYFIENLVRLPLSFLGCTFLC